MDGRSVITRYAAERTHPENGHGRETKSGGHCVRQIDYAQVGDPPVDTGLENLHQLWVLKLDAPFSNSMSHSCPLGHNYETGAFRFDGSSAWLAARGRLAMGRERQPKRRLTPCLFDLAAAAVQGVRFRLGSRQVLSKNAGCGP